MSIEKVLDVLREGFMTILIVAGPTLAIALVVGLIISIIQAATQLQEQTLSFVPKNIGRNRSLGCVRQFYAERIDRLYRKNIRVDRWIVMAKGC